MANIFGTYVRNHPDLLAAYNLYKAHQNPNAVDSWETEGISQGVGGMTSSYPGGEMSIDQFGHTHWAQYGQAEGRTLEAVSSASDASTSTNDAYTDTGHTATPIAGSTWIDNTPTASDFGQTTQAGAEQVPGWDRPGGDYLNYVLSNPGLRENAEALGLTQSEMAEWGREHWITWGSRTIEQVPGHGRANTPFEIRWDNGYTAQWDVGENPPIVYEGMSIEDVLERSIQAQYDVGLSGQGSQVYDMWQAREDISDAWNQGQFEGEGWNFAADQPYATGILADQIEVNPDIGQLVPTTAAENVGDLKFLQDRYLDEAIANDFPVGWTTTDNEWAAAAPQQLGNFWDVLTNATRTPEGILRRVEDYDPLTAVGPSVNPGTRGGGNVRDGGGGGGDSSGGGKPWWVDPNISGSPSTASMLEFRPWEADYWATYLPQQMDQISMGAPVIEPSMSYLPGEFRDPNVWGQWADDHSGHVPEGAWVNNPANWPSYAHQGTPGNNPWQFTAPGGGTNIFQNTWNAPSLGSDAAQKWAGFLAGLGTSPAVDTSTLSLLGV